MSLGASMQLTLAGLLSLTLVGCGSNDDSTTELAPDFATLLQNAVDEQQDQLEAPGIMVGVWRPGQRALVIESGVSDRETRASMSRLDHFRIGSVTKSFTVTVVLQLVDEGLLRLDDTVAAFVPGTENGDATIAELANMRSGIFNYTEDGDFVNEFVLDLQRTWTNQELVDFANGNAPYFAPGDGWHYSNTNTVLLGMIVEQVAGRPLAEVIQERIIAPLALDGTSYPSTADLPSPFVHGYGFDPLEDLSFTDPSSSAGSGAMISTLQGLKAWGEALGRGTLLSEATQAARVNSLEPVVFTPCDDVDEARPERSCPEYDRYGYGLGEISGWIGHTGEYVGYQSLVMYDPATGSVVVIMTNIFAIGEHVPTALFREVADILNAANR
jgi:CubicO group peptidase (beta-lactamase class C family)